MSRGIEEECGQRRDGNGFVECEFDGVRYIAPTWNEMGVATFELAKKIIESGENCDLVVALAKGGWTWTRSLVDYLGLDEIASVRVRFYRSIGQTMAAPEIVQPLSVPVVGKHVLLFDEVIDSGESARMGKSYLLESGAATVRVSTLCYKPRSVVVPDYYAFMTEAWVVFPHEIREAIDQAGGTWLKIGVSMEEVARRFEVMGLPRDQVEYFLGLLTQ
jgi:uncharacterized protein